MSRKSKTLLLVPPYCYPFSPSLGVPMLVGYLKSRGLDVEGQDLSIECQEYFLGEKFLRRIIPKHDVSSNEFISNVQNSINNLRDSKVIISKYIQSIKTINQAYNYISQYYSKFKMDIYEVILKENQANSYSIRELINDRRNNPFICFYEDMNIIEDLIKDRTIIGISICNRSQIIPGLTLAKMIKEQYPQKHVCLGGSFLSIIKESYNDWGHLFDFFDSIIVGEGEEVLNKLIRYIEDSEDFSHLENVIFRDKLNNVVANLNKNIKNRISIAIPDFTGFPLDKYFVPDKIIPYVINREKCIWSKCAFCVHDHGITNLFEKREIDQIIDDILVLKEKYRTDKFDFIIENGLSPKFMVKFSQRLIERDVGIKWRSHYRIQESVDYNTMKKAGCIALYCGVESGSQKILNKMDKGCKVSVYNEEIKKMNDAKIWVQISLIVEFPHEEPEESIKTFQFISSNKNDINSIKVNKFVLSRNSVIWKKPWLFKIKVIKNDKDDMAIDYEYKLEGNVTPIIKAEKYDVLISKLYPDKVIWGNIPGTALFAFLTRYKSSHEAKECFIQEAKN